MFDSLSTRLQDVFKTLRGETRLTPESVETALREIRLALLEADVNFKVVKAFVDRVRDRAMGQDVLRSLSPSQQVVKIVRDEMIALFGDAEGGLQPTSKRPRVVLLLGLQGAGKTTTAGKLAKWLVEQGRHPLLVSTDVKRPAAIEQLNVVGAKASVRVYDPPGELDPVARAKGALAEAANLGFDVDHRRLGGPAAHRRRADGRARRDSGRDRRDRPALRRRRDDGAGRDQERRRVQPADRCDGRRADASSMATRAVARRCRSCRWSACRSRLPAAASASRTSSRSIPTASCRACSAWATCCRSSRRAEAAIDRDDAEKLEAKIRSNEFTLDDFRDQLRTIRKMGPLDQIIGMLPGMGNVKALAENKPDDKQMSRVEAIIGSMTPDERRKQHIINGSRRKRIAKGSGTSVEEVNRLLKQFVQMQKMLKQLGGMAGLSGGGKMGRRRAMQMLRNRG